MEEVGCERTTYDFTRPPMLRRLEGNGIKFDSLDEIKTLDGDHPYLVHNGFITTVHIFDTNQHIDYLSNPNLFIDGQEKQPKFHFLECHTLERMRHNNHFDDHYASSRNKEGLFIIQGLDDNENPCRLEGIKLFVCRNCLRAENYKGYPDADPNTRTDIVREFNIGQFLDDKDAELGELARIQNMPRHNENNAPVNGYNPDFPMISAGLRERHDWCCSKCQVDMSEMHGGLHVHHKNLLRYDDRPSNLEVLCALCHKTIHPQMYVDNNIKNYILEQRRNALHPT